MKGIPKGTARTLGIGVRCCRWIFVRGCSFGGEVPEEQQPRGRRPVVSITSIHQQESLPRGGKERGLSKMTLGFVPSRTAGKGVTEGGAKLVTTLG